MDLLQNDNTLRLKKEVIKAGVVEYFRKYVQKQEPVTEQPPVNNNNNSTPIDLTLDTLRKKVKKQ